MEYLLFQEDRLYDLHEVILPDIYDQLLMTPSFDDAGISCIGAVEKGRTAGAIVFGFQENATVSVLSLYVRQDWRDRGIGSALIRQMLARALQVYDFPDGKVQVRVSMEYTVPQEMAERFRHFLTENHFLRMENTGKIFVVPAVCYHKNRLGMEENKAPAVSCLADLAGRAASEAAHFLAQKGFNADPENCFIAGNPKNPACLLIAEYGAEQDFYVSSVVLREDVGVGVCRAVLDEAVRRIGEEYPDFVLIAEDMRNGHPEIWEELARDGGEIYEHGMAVLAGDFT